MTSSARRIRSSPVLATVLATALLAPAPRAVAGGPCCGVVTVDSATGFVTARENASGRVFQFRVTDTGLLKTLAPGSPVYANFKTRQVSVNGADPCCAIVEGPAAKAGASAQGAGANALPADPCCGVEPCCGIASIDAASGLVTARDRTTGRTFQFKPKDKAFLGTLKKGQSVYANHSTGQVSVDGAQPCCAISAAGH